MDAMSAMDALSATDRKMEAAKGCVPWIPTFIACNLRAVQWLSWRNLAQPPKSGEKVDTLDHKQATDILGSLWLLERLVNTLTLYLLCGGTEDLFALQPKDPNILGPDNSDFLEKRCPSISKHLRFSIE